MPLKTIEAPGDTEQRGVVSASTSDWDASHARDGTSGMTLVAASNGNRHTQARKSGANYIIARGVLAYDFRTANLPRGIRIVRAHLFVGGTTVSAADTNGDKLRVGVITNPTNAGEVTIAATDYDLARYDSNSYTSAQAVVHGRTARSEVIQLDNSILLKHLDNAINNREVLYLSLRNELDFLDDASGVTGVNRVWFNPPSAQGGLFHASSVAQLKIFYRIINNRRNIGTGPGSACSSGFTGISVFGGTNSGFGM